MSAPQYVPHGLSDRPRRGEALPPAIRWTATRPADLSGRQPQGPTLGSQGPDQGYVLKLLPLFHGKVQLQPGEHLHDVESVIIGIALKRASIYGRAPVVHDVEIAYRVWGLLDAAPPELVELRRDLFAGAAHDYARQRRIVDAVPSDALRLQPAQVAERHRADWRSLLSLPA